MIEDAEPIPKPSTLDDLANDPAMQGAVAFGMTGSAYIVAAAPDWETISTVGHGLVHG